MSDYLASDDALRAFCDRARDAGRFGLDVEFIRERTYYPQLALIQLVVGEEMALVDPLEGIDLSPLEELVADESVEKVLHAATQDLEIFFHRNGKLPASIFDTQIAAALVGLGNQISYGRLVEATVGVVLEKGESFTDWLRRPLTDQQERYALDDVRYLLPMADALQKNLESRGRMDWAHQECSRYHDPHLYVAPNETLYKRVKRASSLRRGQNLAVLQELAVWREETARQTDRPRRRVVPDEVLVELARRAPRKPGELQQIRALNPRLASRHGREIVAAVARGLDAPPLRFSPRDVQKRLEAEDEVLVQFLDACARALCLAADIAPMVVYRNADLEAIVRERDADEVRGEHPLLSGWRRELVGDRILEIMRGQVRVCVDPRSGLPTFTPSDAS